MRSRFARVPEKRLEEVMRGAIMAMVGDSQIMYIILICDGGFLSINLELSGREGGRGLCHHSVTRVKV